MADKVRYEIDLTRHRRPAGSVDRVPRAVTRDDRMQLAEVMLDGYRGTIDYEGEGPEEAIAEIDGFFGAAPMLDHSFVVEADGEILSAVLVTLAEDVPFFAYVMTRADRKGRGLARTVTEAAVSSLAEAGYDRAVLYITDGNRPSEALAARVGAVRQTGTP